LVSYFQGLFFPNSIFYSIKTKSFSSHKNSLEHPASKAPLVRNLKDTPQSLDVLSLIVGSLLSNSYMEKHGLGFRIVFIKCSRNVEYLMKFHAFFANNGYCSKKKPKMSKLVGKDNNVIFIYRFKTYSFSNFDWLFNMFYKNNLKIMPDNLDRYLTPLALATLFIFFSEVGQHDNTKNSPLLISNYIGDLPLKYKTASTVSLEELKYLSFILINKYNIDTVIKDKKLKNANKFESLYIKNSSTYTFSKIVKPHLLYSQYNLLNLSSSVGKERPR